jgi:hypothetical protein
MQQSPNIYQNGLKIQNTKIYIKPGKRGETVTRKKNIPHENSGHSPFTPL